MKGYALLTIDNILDIKSRIKHVFDQGYTPQYRTENSFSLFKLRYVENKYITNRPYCKGYEQHILNKLDDIIRMVERKDEVYISLTCYNELCKLAEGESKVNVYIPNY